MTTGKLPVFNVFPCFVIFFMLLFPPFAFAGGKVTELNLGDGVKMKMVLIPAGNFQMGSTFEGDEQPVHEVAILKPFYMGITEVTQAQYEAVMGNNPSNFQGADNPVEKVSWNEAISFCNKLSHKITGTVSLPSEAQWEYACRAGTATKYSCTDDSQLAEYAWYDSNSGSKAHPVGQKKPNAWGLYDMHGNIWEWCSDKWNSNYSGAPSDGSSWDTGYSGRIHRGGCWATRAEPCRSGYRGSNSSTYRYNYLGFRLIFNP